jgi:hypothetical protein
MLFDQERKASKTQEKPAITRWVLIVGEILKRKTGKTYFSATSIRF